MVFLSRRRLLRAAGGAAAGSVAMPALGGMAGPAAAAQVEAGLEAQWVRHLELDAPFRPRAVAETPDGFAVVGNTRIDGERHAAVLRTGPKGLLQSQAVPELDRRHEVGDVAASSDGRLVLATKAPTESGSFLGLVAVDADGSVAWKKTMGNQVSVSTPTAVLELGGDEFLLVGTTLGLGVHLIRVDADGRTRSSERVEFDTRTFFLFAAALAPDGDVYLAGSWQSGVSPVPVDVARVGQDSLVRWRERFETDFDTLAGAMTADDGGALVGYNEVDQGVWSSQFLRVGPDGAEVWRSEAVTDAEVTGLVAREDDFVAGGIAGDDEAAFLAGLDDDTGGLAWTAEEDARGIASATDLRVMPDGRVMALADPRRGDTPRAVRAALAMLTDENKPPVAQLTVDPKRPAAGDEVTLSAAPSFDQDSWLLSIAWDVGDDGSVESREETVSFTLEEATTVRLFVTDAAGARVTKTVRVEPHTPTPTNTSTPTATPTSSPVPGTTTTTVPGFGVVGALGGLAGAAALRRWRRGGSGNEEEQ